MHADGFKLALSGDGADELFANNRAHELGYAAGDAFGEVIRNQSLALMARDTCSSSTGAACASRSRRGSRSWPP